MNSAAISKVVQVFLSYVHITAFGYKSGSEIAGSYSESIFNFLRNRHAVHWGKRDS